MRVLGELCRRRDVLLISDEVYNDFCYDHPFTTSATWNDDVLVVDGFSKTYGMTGWRLGYAHGPSRLIQEMAKLQQFSFVCAPSMAQYGGVVALDQDLTSQIDGYRRKRDMVVEALSEDFELSLPEGAFYAFPRAPWGTGTEFVAEAIKNNLLIIPGNVFSQRDSHFRISYAVDDATLRRGLDLLRKHSGVAGQLDLAVADAVADVVVVDGAGDILFRRGSPDEPGSFLPPVTINPGYPSRDIASVPNTLNGPLLASVDAEDDAVSLYAYRDGTFVRIGALMTGDLPAQIIAADLNGDGVD